VLVAGSLAETSPHDRKGSRNKEAVSSLNLFFSFLFLVVLAHGKIFQDHEAVPSLNVLLSVLVLAEWSQAGTATASHKRLLCKISALQRRSRPQPKV
jgi:hypothetical protein